MMASGGDRHAMTIMYNFKWMLYCVLIAKWIVFLVGFVAPFQLCTSEVPFLPSRQSLDISDESVTRRGAARSFVSHICLTFKCASPEDN